MGKIASCDTDHATICLLAGSRGSEKRGEILDQGKDTLFLFRSNVSSGKDTLKASSNSLESCETHAAGERSEYFRRRMTDKSS